VVFNSRNSILRLDGAYEQKKKMGGRDGGVGKQGAFQSFAHLKEHTGGRERQLKCRESRQSQEKKSCHYGHSRGVIQKDIHERGSTIRRPEWLVDLEWLWSREQKKRLFPVTVAF